ncbi:MAG: hypothetical protein NZ602_14635 [Thermoguttaceae bacterium]|nr:hypothetical protein [Thermoguttaceae bacterium]MDW8036535.1 hypothetical protein [Thermoguttaceae bacterium]
MEADSANQGDVGLAITDQGPLGLPCQLLPETIADQINGEEFVLQGQTRRQPADPLWPSPWTPPRSMFPSPYPPRNFANSFLATGSSVIRRRGGKKNEWN